MLQFWKNDIIGIPNAFSDSVDCVDYGLGNISTEDDVSSMSNDLARECDITNTSFD